MAEQKKARSESNEQELRAQLAQKDEERRSAKDQLDRERLTRVTDDVIQTITSPAFMDRMQRARQASDRDDGMVAAAQLLSIDSLREAGAEIPKDFRMTSRVFEDRIQGARIEIRDTPVVLDPGGPLAWGVCGGGGGLTFCGCGGFST